MTTTTTQTEKDDYPKNPETEEEIHELLEKAPRGTRLKLKDARLDDKEIKLGEVEKKRDRDGRVWRKTWKHETVTGSENGGLTYVVMGPNYTYSSVEVIE